MALYFFFFFFLELTRSISPTNQSLETLMQQQKDANTKNNKALHTLRFSLAPYQK